MSSRARGRHRAPGRLHPVANCSVAVVRHAGPAAQVPFVLVASGGVVLTLAVPAQAGTEHCTETDTETSALPTPGNPPAAAGASAAAAPVVLPPRIHHANSTTVIKTATRPMPAEAPVITTATPALLASAPVIKTAIRATSDTATGLSASSATQAISRTVEFAAARSQAVSSQALARRLDRAALRSRPAAAGGAVPNRTFPVPDRAIAWTARHQASTVRLAGTARGAAAAVNIASGLTGIWYRWGGSSPSGFECSGYTSYVYRKLGVRLPRPAAAQQAYAKRVRTPRPGDLVFFGVPAHHVGIYAGGGMMYDAPSRGRKTQLRKVSTTSVTYGRIGGTPRDAPRPGAAPPEGCAAGPAAVAGQSETHARRRSGAAGPPRVGPRVGMRSRGVGVGNLNCPAVPWAGTG